jgi:Tol biopolymer transport system component
MAIDAGTKLGPYEIISALGAGGMGEVYRATDTRLGRTVAIKVLPSHLSADPQFRQRFDREAKTISSLSHPHICTLHDIGHENGIDFLVMEFLEGETLAQKLSKGPLTTELALQLGIQIAGALDKAHKQGIVHRDLKPGNIMLTKSGAKLLDFGLAKLQVHPSASGETGVSELATKEPHITGEGSILGTVPYMAPEQLEGKDADSRTDIFAFGVTLYEMITGKKAFTGKSQASLIAAILEKDPQPMSELQPMTPPALERIVKTCLAKDPEDRWQNAHDLMNELKWIGEGSSQAVIAAPIVRQRKNRERVAWGIAILGIALAVALGIQLLRSGQRPVAEPRLARLSMVHGIGSGTAFPAISPDGTRVAYGAPNQEGIPILWIRRLDSFEPQPLAGTDYGELPFWSPDSRDIAFFAERYLKRIPAAGGPVKIVASTAGYWGCCGGTWGKGGTILFAGNDIFPILRVPEEGGKVEAVTKLPGHSWGHWWPSFLPDGRHFVFFAFDWSKTIETTRGGIYMGSLDSPEIRRILPDYSRAIYAPPGFLVFERKGRLMAIRLDDAGTNVVGDAVPLGEQVETGFEYTSEFSISGDGTIAYRSASDSKSGRQMHWLDRTGKVIAKLGGEDDYEGFKADISPDARQIAATIDDPLTLNGDIWILDSGSGSKTRLISSPHWDGYPVWSPDGSQIAYATQPSGLDDVFLYDLRSRKSTPLIVSEDRMEHPIAWSRDGRYLLISTVSGQETGQLQMDLYAWSFPEEKLTPFHVSGPLAGDSGMFSPDASYVAYCANETGHYQAYVTTFPDAREKWQITRDGATNVLGWNAEGEILISTPGGDIAALSVRADHGFQVGDPMILARGLGGLGAATASVTSDHSRILVQMNPIEKQGVAEIRLLMGWADILLRGQIQN